MTAARGEEAVMERLNNALIEYATYAARVEKLGTWDTARGPMGRKQHRLHREAAEALRNARAFDDARAKRIWASVEDATRYPLLFEERSIDPRMPS